jgi:histidine triad (HIT) family protein
MDQDCIFCQIVAGKIPAHQVYADENILAFLDIKPVNEGHILVIPKKHVPYFYQLDDELYSALMLAVKKISEAVNETLNPNKVGLLVKGFDVDHAHVHIIPLNKDSDITRTTPVIDPNTVELAGTAQQVASRL